MKRLFCLYLAFVIFLVGFNYLTGRTDRDYKSSVTTVVDFVNKVGDVSSTVIGVFLPVGKLSDLPGTYQSQYKILSGFSEHEPACDEALIKYIYNQYYSDVKKYYFGQGDFHFKNSFESLVLGWSGAIIKSADPSLVKEIYEEGLELGYSMDNPLIDTLTLFPFKCICDK